MAPNGLVCGGRVDEAADCGDAIGWEAALAGVFADGSFVGGEIDAVHFVAGDVALQPLDFGAHGFENRHGLARDFLDFGVGEIAESGDFALDDELGHVIGSAKEMLASKWGEDKCGQGILDFCGF